jgi:hypothetical protein
MLRIRSSIAAVLVGLLIVACSAGATQPPTHAPSVAPPSVALPSATAAPTATPAPTAATTPPSPTQSAGSEIGCDRGGHDGAYHIHSLVGVKVDGSLYAPPANIGITSCMYWVHTHAADGIVHVEAPAIFHPTLGDFLDIWEETYPDDQLLANAREAIAAGEVTVDDKPFAGDALALQLADRMRIFLGS